jgi:hypothetical protein
MLSRRGFLGSILALSSAPFVVRAESLMVLPVRRIVVPQSFLWLVHGDGTQTKVPILWQADGTGVASYLARSTTLATHVMTETGTWMNFKSGQRMLVSGDTLHIAWTR